MQEVSQLSRFIISLDPYDELGTTPGPVMMARAGLAATRLLVSRTVGCDALGSDSGGPGGGRCSGLVSGAYGLGLVVARSSSGPPHLNEQYRRTCASQAKLGTNVLVGEATVCRLAVER